MSSNETAKHVFETAGLGVAPFKFVRIEVRMFQAAPGCPVKAGSSCDFCGMSIANCAIIRDSQGKEFKVGCDCALKTGDAGLVKAIKKSQAKNAKNRSESRVSEAVALLPQVADVLKSQPHPRLPNATLYDYVAWMFEHAGMTGKMKAARIVKKAA